MESPSWWKPSWTTGTENDPEAGWHESSDSAPSARHVEPDQSLLSGQAAEESILATLEAQVGQIRSRDRVRDLAEVFTHQREVDAILDSVADAFHELDVKFLEPSSGSGNFLVEILARKLRLVTRIDCASQEHYEHRLLRALASTYGVDISHENVVEARGRLAHTLLEHYRMDANTAEPTAGFVQAAAAILDANVVHGNMLTDAETIELCDWQPHSRGRFRRVWSRALVPEHERDLFWAERVQDADPVHYSDLATANMPSLKRKSRTKR